MATQRGEGIALLRSAQNPATPAAIDALSKLVNGVYRQAEAGIWVAGYERTSSEEIRRLWLRDELILAQKDNGLIGCIHVAHHHEDTAVFGMLVTASASRGQAVGTRLLDAAEQRGRDLNCNLMRLELLTPRLFRHPVKAFLSQWYERVGYHRVEHAAFEEKYPHLAADLATPCDFIVYTKSLR